jgi:hypothetical protein
MYVCVYVGVLSECEGSVKEGKCRTGAAFFCCDGEVHWYVCMYVCMDECYLSVKEGNCRTGAHLFAVTAR